MSVLSLSGDIDDARQGKPDIIVLYCIIIASRLSIETVKYTVRKAIQMSAI